PRRRSHPRMARVARENAREQASRLKSATGREDRCELVRRNHFELRVGAIGGFLVRAPAPEVRGVAETRALDVVVSDLGHELGPHGFPRQILALAPAALAAGHALAFRFIAEPRPLLP